MEVDYSMNDSKDLNGSQQQINYYNVSDYNVNANTSVLVTEDEVTVIPSHGNHSCGSSKVKLTNLVDYTWEQRFYTGQILAVHISGKYIAYGIQGKESGIIRVISFSTSERALIKGIEGMAQDIAFAFIIAPVLLACIDSIGDVYVYTVEENQLNALSCCLSIHIKQSASDPLDGIQRIVWCPYVPDDEQGDEEDDSSKLIVTRGNKAHVWNVNVIHAQHGIIPVTSDTVSDGFLEIDVDQREIVDVAFSPDGSTVALACSDGGVRFYQIDVENGEIPNCIHDWRPHEGKPVSCLYFLDNHLDADCSFWKFAVTGVEGNSEIKIWTCETWSCLQTLKYAPVNSDSSSPVKLKVAVDITASFILLSDMQRKLLHVLQLRKNEEETGIRVYTISEFLLPYPILSFGIVKATLLHNTSESTSPYNDDKCDFDDKNNGLKTVIKLYLVQPKALQECNIVFNAEEVTNKFNHSTPIVEADNSAIVLNGLSSDSTVTLLTPNSFSTIAADPSISEKFLPVSVIENNQKHLPASVEGFESNIRRKSHEISRRSLDRDTITHHIGSGEINGCEETEEEEGDGDRNGENGSAVVNEGKSYYSTSSSPSREVQNILFSTAINDQSCRNMQAKSNENDLPVIPNSVWPKIPIPDPHHVCPDVSSAIRMSTSDKMRIRNESTDDKSGEYKRDLELRAVYAKIDVLEERLNQLNENVKSQQQDIRQTVSLLNQLLVASKEDEKKKQKGISNEEKYLQERIVNAITQNVNSVIGNEVEYFIKGEINTNVLPSLKNTMDTFGQQFNTRLTQHLNNADQQMKEYIVKTVQKKSVTDAVANTLASSLPPVISNSFAEVFCNVILPKFEKSCQEMFHQVNTLFVEGTRDFVGVLQSHVRSYEEKQSSLLQSKVDEFVLRLKETSETANMNAIRSITPELTNSVKRALEEQKILIESSLLNINKTQAVGHLNMVQKPHEQIEFLITQGKIDMAIEQVLSASDLKLLVCLCEKLDPDKIFSDPCKIQQHILLSFIQQLSVDLADHTDLKHRFIEGAIMCLDKKHPVCEKNFSKILPAVRNRIAHFINTNPTNKNTRNMKILLMALDSLLSDKVEDGIRFF